MRWPRALAQLRETIKEPGNANDGESQAFLREAEELIEDKPVQPVN